jgi:ribosome-binding factor A
MESKRQQKFSKQMQKDLSDIFQKDLKGAFGPAFITLTDVKMSPDLSQAKTYLSIMLAPSREETLREIRIKTNQIRNLLAGKIRHQVRIIPELQFYIDDTAEYAAKMDAIISALDIPPLKPGEVIEM